MPKTPVPQEHTENPLEPVLRRQVEELLAFFDYTTLPQRAKATARAYHALAHDVARTCTWNFMLVEALRLTLGAKDAAVRALLLEREEVGASG